MALVLSPECERAYLHLVDGDIDWLVFGYRDTRNRLFVDSVGHGYLDELKQSIPSRYDIFMGFIRIYDLILFWILLPGSVSGVKQAQAKKHADLVQERMPYFDGRIYVSKFAELTELHVFQALRLDQAQVAKMAAEKEEYLLRQMESRYGDYEEEAEESLLSASEVIPDEDSLLGYVRDSRLSMDEDSFIRNIPPRSDSRAASDQVYPHFKGITAPLKNVASNPVKSATIPAELRPSGGDINASASSSGSSSVPRTILTSFAGGQSSSASPDIQSDESFSSLDSRQVSVTSHRKPQGNSFGIDPGSEVSYIDSSLNATAGSSFALNEYDNQHMSSIIRPEIRVESPDSDSHTHLLYDYDTIPPENDENLRQSQFGLPLPSIDLPRKDVDFSPPHVDMYLSDAEQMLQSLSLTEDALHNNTDYSSSMLPLRGKPPLWGSRDSRAHRQRRADEDSMVCDVSESLDRMIGQKDAFFEALNDDSAPSDSERRLEREILEGEVPILGSTHSRQSTASIRGRNRHRRRKSSSRKAQRTTERNAYAHLRRPSSWSESGSDSPFSPQQDHRRRFLSSDTSDTEISDSSSHTPPRFSLHRRGYKSRRRTHRESDHRAASVQSDRHSLEKGTRNGRHSSIADEKKKPRTIGKPMEPTVVYVEPPREILFKPAPPEFRDAEMVRLKAEIKDAFSADRCALSGYLSVQTDNSLLLKRRFYELYRSHLILYKEDERVALINIKIPGQIHQVDLYDEDFTVNSFRLRLQDENAKLDQCFLFSFLHKQEREALVLGLFIATRPSKPPTLNL